MMVATAAIALGAGVAIKEFVAFDQAITSTSAKFADLNLQTQEGQRTLEELGITARQVGATTEFTATQAGEGLEFLALAGLSATQSMTALPEVVDLATASQLDLSRATDISTDTLGAFNLMTEDTIQLQANMARVNDVLAATSASANTDVEQLFEAIGNGAATFSNAGQSIETFSALAGKMANATIKGGEAGTALRNVMLRLSDPSAEAADELQRLGINIADENGNFRDIIDIIGDFEDSLAGLGEVERTTALSTIFGARTVNSFNVLLNEGSDSLREYRGALEQSEGAASRMADTIRGSLQNRLATLKSAALEVGFKFVEAFEEQGGEALGTLTEAVRNFNVQGVLDGISNVIGFFRTLINIVKPFLPIILSILAAWKAYQAILLIVAAAQAVLNAVMAANPVTLIILAIGALIGIIIILVKNWEKVKDFFLRTLGRIADFFRFVGGVISNVWNSAIDAITERWERFKERIVAIFNFIREIAAMVSDGFKEAWRNALDSVGGFFRNIWENFIQPVLEGIGRVVEFINPFDKESRDRRADRREERQERRADRRVDTTRETVERSISESRQTSEIVVRNDGTSDVETPEGPVFPGSSIRLQPSG
jgi:TP901 family phage tail tape measure protein